MSTIVKSFARAGIYPVNGDMVKKGGTLDPAKLYCESSDSSLVPTGTSESDTSEKLGSGTQAAASSLKTIEGIMGSATVSKYNERYTEGYDVPGD